MPRRGNARRCEATHARARAHPRAPTRAAPHLVSRSQVSREKDALWRELHARENRSRDAAESEQSAALHGEALRLRAQLQASERERELLLSSATASQFRAVQRDAAAAQQHANSELNRRAADIARQHQSALGPPAPPLPVSRPEPDWTLRSASRYHVSFPLD